ncbi:metal dependent phosphohydrolase [Solidesulfovibrio carbinoliphilus subsp. oakridgensis]|uniref:Metal dependent phosphohydrolase n=1 Tax=Solidesulfovibrio carbinoliphilus subsp. oakridgensis TaxID=694327 RepID=G7Q6E4_9BACT|nr:CRISPR-associated helicase/endonuclease Cas3 [Solidesulfovibrio carbinoliphilus]EHJ47317.1 metal dependent phosphohydrolase [Solidesulfovibrio carbinoliphilus subsp. oakridgensis]
MYHYWGKAAKGSTAHHLLVYHCLDVAATLRALLDADKRLHQRLHALAPAVAPADLDALLLYFAVLHDLGKFAPAFQQQRQDIVDKLDGPPAKRICNAHHSHLGKAIFFDEDIVVAWQPSLLCRDGWPHKDILAPLTDAAFGHHGKPPQDLSDSNLRLPPSTAAAIRQFMGEVCSRFLPGPLTLPGGDAANQAFRPVSWFFAGLLVVADWLASGQGFAYCETPMDLAVYWNERALPQARATVADCGMVSPLPRQGGGFHELLPHIEQKYGPTPLQAYALEVAGRDSGPRLFIFEDVTGAGKTEAALLAAHAVMAGGEAHGFYIGLPTMATANGMYARMAASYRALFMDADTVVPSLMLAHGARGIQDAFLHSIGLERGRDGESDAADGEQPDSGAFCAAWLADNRKKSLLAPCGVGTLDQALLAVLPAKHQCLRLLGLGRNVLIADEVHAYDPYTTRLLETLLTFQAGLGGCAILLSATLPRRIKQGLAAAFCRGAGYPVPAVSADPLPLATRLANGVFTETPLAQTRTLSVAVTLCHDPAEALDRLVAVHTAGGCAILLCNTVDRAMAARNLLAERLPPADVLLFHARFALCDRLAIEERVLAIFGKGSTTEIRRGKILVATQVIEQSLDVDADFLVTELAPMELVLQRAGRCQRHNRKWRPAGFVGPAVLVLSPPAVDEPGPGWGEAELGKGLFVYPGHDVLWRTAQLLARWERVELPRDARELVEGAYDADALPTPAALQSAEDKQTGKASAEKSLALFNGLEFSQGYGTDAAAGHWHDDRETPTRLGEERVTLRLVRVVDDGLALWAGEGLDAATCARSEVSVPKHRGDALAATDAWQERLDAFAATLPDKGRWVRLVPFVETETAGVWHCALPGTTAVYSREGGLNYG